MTTPNHEPTITLSQIIESLSLTLLTHPGNFSEQIPTAGYTSDLLSCVMASAPHQGVWVTLQAHTNVVAVAALLDLCAVIITEGALPEAATIQKANEENVVLLSTPKSSYFIVGKLWELGLHASL